MKKKKRSKKLILTLHKYLGLITGLVVFIVAITGCFWSFKEEIEELYSEYKIVTPMDNNFVKPSEVKDIAQKYFVGKTIHGVKYGSREEAIEVIFYQAEPKLFYRSLFLNPYSGKIIKSIDHTVGFFAFVMNGHVRLWLPKKIGGNIVSVSVLMFMIIIVSGLFIWWPKKIKNLKQRVRFKWNDNTKWKRKNFDLHAVLGFYVSTFGFIIAFTGCVMAFNWFYYITYKATGGQKSPQFVMPESKKVLKKENVLMYDSLIPYLYKTYDKASSFELHYPENDSVSILVEVENSKGLHYDMDYLFYDQNTIKKLETTSIYGEYKYADFADKIIRMNYDLHIGSIGGVIGKIIVFLISLLCATLPVTGILLWFGKNYKK